MGPPEPQISVVVPTLGSYASLARVLDGYERQALPPGSFELIVVSDLADPAPHEVDGAIGSRPYPVRRLTGSRPGASANRNAGWQAARAPVVLFTDNDTIPTPPLLAEHLAAHARHPQREWAVAGRIRWAPGITVTPFMRWLDRGVQFDFHRIRGEEASWAQLYTANCSIKRAMIDLVGGYDEVRLPDLYEDLDWGYRAHRHGLRVAYLPVAVVDHWRPMTVETWTRRAPLLAAAEWQFCRLHPDVPPFFYDLFTNAMRHGPGSGRVLRVVGLVPERLPWIGPRIWSRAGLAWSQAIAPYFLEAWDRAAAADGAVSPSPGDAALVRSGTPAGP
jgi:GT2 family glycosyltransferase